MRAAALAVAAADLREMPESGGARFLIRIARNSFGWGGGGRLVANREGLRFTARRAGLVGYVLPRDSLFVPPSRIASVLREAEIIRLHLRGESGRDSLDLEFMADSAAAAASIVTFLPAGETVELEMPPRRPEATSRRSTALRAAGVAVMAVTVVAALLMLERRPPAPSTAAEAEPGRTVPDLPRARAIESESIPASQLSVSRSELRAAEDRTAAMKRKFALELRDLMDGKITQSNFALRLNRDLIPQWRQERGELSNRFDRVSTQLTVLDLLKRSADLWTQALALYSEGLREQRPDKVTQAFAIIGRAEALEASAYDLVRRAETRSASAASGQP
jgi:hypothetical protein